SAVGTSGGNKATIINCYSKDSGTTAITMNSRNSAVIGCIVEGNRQFNGILIGHTHEEEQWAEQCLVANCVVVDSAGDGIAIYRATNASLSGNVVKNAGQYGYRITGSTAAQAQVSITGG